MFLPVLHIANVVAPKIRSRWLNQLFAKINNQRFKHEKPNDGTNWLSVSLTNRKAFLDDKLCGVPFSNNAFLGLISLNVKATRSNWAENIPHSMPILLVSGIDDPIGNFGKGVQTTARKLQNQGFEHVDIKLYSNMRHEILNEDDRLLIFQDIAAWLAKYANKETANRVV